MARGVKRKFLINQVDATINRTKSLSFASAMFCFKIIRIFSPIIFDNFNNF